MAVEMTAYELVNLGLGSRMEILELVHSLELLDVQTIGENTIRLSLEKMFRFVGGDMRDGGEDVGTMGSGTFDAVSVIYTTFSGLVIDVKILEIIIKVDRSGAKVTTEKGGVCGEDSGDINMALATEWNSKSCLPFVEMGDDGGVKLASDVLNTNRSSVRGDIGEREHKDEFHTSPRNHATR